MWADAEKFLSKDKFIGPLIQKWGHCTIKPVVKSKYFEHLVNAICSQQLSGKAAETIFGRVKKLLFKITPDTVLKADDLKLRESGLSFQKVKYVKDLAIRIKNKELILNNLNSLQDEEIINELVKVKGIGRWTAEMFLMFGLGRTDILPKNDLGINNALKNLGIVEKDTDKWMPYRTIASWYLWRSLENR